MDDFERWMKPIWDTDIVYDESLMFLRGTDGDLSAPLLFKPNRILSVMAANRSAVYKEGQDWVLDGQRIRLPESSRIFHFEQDELYPREPIEKHTFPMPDGRYNLFYEGHFFHDRQVVVTYECDKGQWDGILPEYAGDKLPNTMRRLKNGEPLKVVFYGASISVGCNASKFVNCPPYQPAWMDLVIETLRRNYTSEITVVNTAVGGTDTRWAVETTEEHVNAYKPDLVFIDFGGNDVRMDPDEFAGNIAAIREKIRAEFPETEYVLLATMVPSKLLGPGGAQFYGNQPEHRRVLKKLCGVGTVLASISDLQDSVYAHKRFIDLTANNVNHPNDFFHRLMAQYISGFFVR